MSEMVPILSSKEIWVERCGQSLRDTAHCRCIWKEMLRRNNNWLVWLGIVSYQDDIQNPDVCSRFFYQSLAQCLVFKVLFCAMWLLIAWLIARPWFFSLVVSASHLGDFVATKQFFLFGDGPHGSNPRLTMSAVPESVTYPNAYPNMPIFRKLVSAQKKTWEQHW